MLKCSNGVQIGHSGVYLQALITTE